MMPRLNLKCLLLKLTTNKFISRADMGKSLPIATSDGNRTLLHSIIFKISFRGLKISFPFVGQEVHPHLHIPTSRVFVLLHYGRLPWTISIRDFFNWTYLDMLVKINDPNLSLRRYEKNREGRVTKFMNHAQKHFRDWHDDFWTMKDIFDWMHQVFETYAEEFFKHLGWIAISLLLSCTSSNYPRLVVLLIISTFKFL